MRYYKGHEVSKRNGQLNEWIHAAKRIAFFGGAGVSVASGIPDFRSPGGLYETSGSAEVMLHVDFMLRKPDLFWPFYRHVFMAPNNGPNLVHRALANIESSGQWIGVITQNVDGLHQMAGSKRVLELHGSTHHFSCMSCKKAFSFAAVEAMDVVPTCTTCGGHIRPDIVLYGEGLRNDVVEAAIDWIASADLIMVAGTSLVVYPAAGFLQARSDTAKLVLLNRETTSLDHVADLLIPGDLVETFDLLGFV